MNNTKPTDSPALLETNPSTPGPRDRLSPPVQVCACQHACVCLCAFCMYLCVCQCARTCVCWHLIFSVPITIAVIVYLIALYCIGLYICSSLSFLFLIVSVYSFFSNILISDPGRIKCILSSPLGGQPIGCVVLHSSPSTPVPAAPPVVQCEAPTMQPALCVCVCV